ncbi:MAG: hypothetical protein SAJ12_06875 [Jaaginema sp. PMC 1079.18]|nr:hypothetical protein [Jaaginema sp. PMC 1080.18]MEC4850718.1 hypothetical protein [Jaaginema sp. PMC 1079.18]MEC4867729.1 hypothetical protein [Jaaginema sp. PMC 1078.18]
MLPQKFYYQYIFEYSVLSPRSDRDAGVDISSFWGDSLHFKLKKCYSRSPS